MPGFKLRADKFNQIRMLLDSGAFSNQQIAEITGWSSATIGYVSRVKTYDEYKALMQTISEVKRIRYGADKQIKETYEKNLEAAKVEQEPKQEPVKLTPDYTEAYQERIIELLKGIDKRLAQMATLWGLPKEDNGDGVINVNVAGYKPF